MDLSKDVQNKLAALVQKKVKESLEKSGKFPPAPVKEKQKLTEAKKPEKQRQQLNEAYVVTPGSFTLKTEKISKRTKEAHETLYKKYIDTFNKVSSELDAVNRQSANSFSSLYRAFKIDECYNLNAIKLHELYWLNISDLASEIAVDSLPYMKFSRDFGTFEDWQFDFMACAMSAKEGWALTVYEPYKNCYMNICVDGHDKGIPVGCIPVLAMDMWSHAFFKDYDIDKKSYLIAMMRELNWDVIEARMVLAEKSELGALYAIQPVYNDHPEKLLQQAEAGLEAPIDDVKDISGAKVAPSNPAAPEALLDKDSWERGY